MFEPAPLAPPPTTGIIDALRRFAPLAAAITVAGVLLGVLAGFALRPEPQASARMTLADPRSTSLFVTGQGVQVELDRYLSDRAGVARSADALGRAGSAAGVDPDELRRSCSVLPAGESTTLRISCSMATEAEAVASVDAIAAAYKEITAAEFAASADAAVAALDEDRSRLLQELEAAGAGQVGQVLAQATASRIAEIETRRTNIRTTVALFGDGVSYYDPARAVDGVGLVGQLLRFGFIGFAAGLVVAVLVAWFRADSRPIAAESDGIVDALGMPELGSVAEPGDEASLFEPSPPHRLVLANITAALEKGIVAFTEVSPTPGYAATVVRLAVAAAQGGARVLLVDADTAELPVARALGLGAGPGLAQVLGGETSPESVTTRVNLPRLPGTTAGTLGLMRPGFTSDDLASLLQARRAHPALDLLRSQFDVVVVAAPPLLASAVATAAARVAEGTVVVTERGVPLATLAHVRRQVEYAANRRLGFVLLDGQRAPVRAGGVLAPVRFAG